MKFNDTNCSLQGLKEKSCLDDAKKIIWINSLFTENLIKIFSGYVKHMLLDSLKTETITNQENYTKVQDFWVRTSKSAEKETRQKLFQRLFELMNSNS